MAWTTVSTYSATTWTGLASNGTVGWPVTGPVSVETRVNRIYPQLEAQGIVPFIWHVQSNRPLGPDFYVASGSGVAIRSSITESIH